MQSSLSEGAGEPGTDNGRVQPGRQHYRAEGGSLWAVHVLQPDWHEGKDVNLQPCLCLYLKCRAVLMLLPMAPWTIWYRSALFAWPSVPVPLLSRCAWAWSLLLGPLVDR